MYDYELFRRNINGYKLQVEKMDQSTEKNKKILKALKDTIDVLDSLNELNPAEANTYLQIFSSAIGASYIMKPNR